MLPSPAGAEQAIANNVDKAAWERILKSLEAVIEIYERVYPGRDPMASGNLKITDSTPARFDATKQFTNAEKTALRTVLAGLTTAQVLARERDASLIGDVVVFRVPAPAAGLLLGAGLIVIASARRGLERRV